MATNAYAPYPPEIVGNSWVPIVEDPYELAVRNERGYWFNLSASSTVVTSRIYVGADAIPNANATPVTNIYPESGLDWGPVKQLSIPAITVFNTNFPGTTITTSSSTTPVSAVYSPNDGNIVRITGTSTGIIGLNFNFNVTSFATQLTGKRILKLELAYVANWQPFGSQAGTPLVEASYWTGNGASVGVGDGAVIANLVDSYYGLSTTDVVTPSYLEIPLATPLYNTVTGNTTGDRYPWNYTSLARFDPSTTAAQRNAIQLLLSNTEGTQTGDSFYVMYLALRVTYCNETRVGLGGRSSDNLPPQRGFGPVGTAYSMPILDTALSAAPVLPAGNYYVTVDNTLMRPDFNLPAPGLRALHQLYAQQYPGIHGVDIPISTTPFTAASNPEDTNHLLAISLHTASAVVADSHGYGQQLMAPVYTGVNANQEILNAAETNGTAYSMARFYARRFGQTSSPLGLRLQSSGTAVASISVGEFDALDEIVNGWKQVDLTFTSPPTFNTSGNSTYEFFSATPSGARWEVLGARATNVTGFNFVEVGPNHWLPPTTYGGSTQVASWEQGSGTTTIDRQGDLTLMFATMPQVTGLEADGASIDVSYVEHCEQAPGAIPTAVDYVTLSWDGSSVDLLGDTFSRTEASGWGTADTGQAWTAAVGANIYSVSNGVGQATPAAPATSYINMSAYSTTNTTVTATVAAPQLVSSQANVYIVLRYADSNNHYLARVAFENDGRVGVSLNKRVGGVDSSIAALTYPGVTYSADLPVNIKAQIVGSLLQVKVWSAGDTEPTHWGTAGTDTSLTAAGLVGIRFEFAATGYTFTVDDFVASSGFGALELQREDDFTDWQTIMLATSPLVTSFNDFEARVGVESRYRIRVCHELDFCGEWSDEAAHTVPAPGVSGTDIPASVLIFTSNANQDGSSILAYVEAFEGTPAETFTLLEASDISFQPMYNRNYRVAFHGTERGGEQFARNILLNNAAVTIINFDQAAQALRNLAWEDNPYTAVRDGHGSRWLANVTVPQVTIQPPYNMLQYAQIIVTEVTDTAYPINPETP